MGNKKAKDSEPSKLYKLLPVLLCGLSIPLSMFMWMGNLAYATIFDKTNHGELEVIPPTRWLASTLIPLLFAVYGFKKRSVDLSGAILGFCVAFILTLSNYGFLSCLIVFFISGSRATKFKGHLKSKFEEGFKEGGQRNWLQVLCNSGMATQLAFLYILDCGCGERPINFISDYRASWLQLGVMGAFSCCNGDTWASELGSVIGKGDPWLITSRKRVPRGTNGGVSIVGLIVSWLGGMLVGLGNYVTIFYSVDSAIYASSPSQWPLILMGGAAGLLGSIVDSILGATLQYSGKDESGHIVESPGPGVKHISGRRFLDNHSVNLLSSIFTGLFIPIFAKYFW